MSIQELSPFHKGEQTLQSLTGVRDRMERFGKQVIRNYMPDQHRDFFNQLPFIFVGHADNDGWPWASILYGKPGFISSPDPKQLAIEASVVKGDPLEKVFSHKGSNTTRLGLLGIELPSRRRNRLAAHISSMLDGKMQLEIDQAFGNCPQYIQTRRLEWVQPEDQSAIEIKDLDHFDKDACDLIANSDTFFVASYIENGSNDASEGVDVSHRGGRPGFIRIDNQSKLTIPDYTGNFHFNTLGNFLENPKAGLLFIDFEHGHLLTVTGRVEVLFESDDMTYFEGAERLWTFTIEQGRWLKNALPLRWQLDEYSPNTEMTGTWREAEQISQAEQQRNSWQPYKVVAIEDESSVIKSFYLESVDGSKPNFKAGQFLSVKTTIAGKEQIRTYTVSNAPAEEHYRISVKRETHKAGQNPNGVFSNFLHDQFTVGDSLDVKAPTGNFFIDTSVLRPAVLISAGVGITPMIAMMRHALREGVRTRKPRSMTFIHAAHDQQQRAFFKEIKELTQNSAEHFHSYWVLSEIDDDLKPGVDFHQQGRISKAMLQAVLPIDDYDFYLCGPPGFMQAMYDLLQELAVDDNRIYAEEFGPASLNRTLLNSVPAIPQINAAQEAIIEFSDSKVEQAWAEGDGTLLEFAEAHGLTPEFSCRSGQCASCKAKLNSGKVTYPTEPAALVDIASDEILLCCALPAISDNDGVVRLSIKV